MKDMEFSGVFDIGLNHKKILNNIVYYKYFLFIKFKDLIYIDIKNVGEIIIPFTELMNHCYLRKYYELSLLLTENKHKVIEKKSRDDRYDRYDRYDRSEPLYKIERDWFIDSAYFVEDFTTKLKRVEKGKYYNYYNIDPNDLRSRCASSAEEVERFYEVLKIRYGYEQSRTMSGLGCIFMQYMNLMIEYNINIVGEEVENIAKSQEDDKNFANLLELNKKGMNADIFDILYKSIISTKGQLKYENMVPR